MAVETAFDQVQDLVFFGSCERGAVCEKPLNDVGIRNGVVKIVAP